MAERTGLIGLLDEWTLREAGRQQAEWDAAAPKGRVGPVASISVRPAQLDDPDYLDAVAETLDTTGLSPSRLRLLLVGQGTDCLGDELVATLRRLHDSGMQIAMDGFGAGPSSLPLMRRLPLDWVQIDEEIVGRLDVEATDMVLVRLIVESAHSLGLRVCATGVSRPAQVEWLMAVGVDAAQGDLLGGAEEPALVDTRTRVANTVITQQPVSPPGCRRPPQPAGP